MSITTIILLGVIGYLLVDRQIDKHKCEHRTKDLFNRLMARDFDHYVHGTQQLDEQKKGGKLLKNASNEELVTEYEAREAMNPDVLNID